jgi:hypothetical protein
MALVLALSGLQAGLQARDAKAIAAAKNTIVHQIEPSLPNKAFSVWLRNLVGPKARIQWEVNDCGEQTGNPESDKGRDFPMCAEVQTVLPRKRTLYISFSVGTFKTGVRAGSVQFAYAVIVQPRGPAKSIKKLSQVPEAIKASP